MNGNVWAPRDAFIVGAKVLVGAAALVVALSTSLESQRIARAASTGSAAAERVVSSPSEASGPSNAPAITTCRNDVSA